MFEQNQNKNIKSLLVVRLVTDYEIDVTIIQYHQGRVYVKKILIQVVSKAKFCVDYENIIENDIQEAVRTIIYENSRWLPEKPDFAQICYL